MEKVFFYVYETEIGTVTFISTEKALRGLHFRDMEEELKNTAIKKETALMKEAKQQLDEYLKGERKEFSIPLDPEGTEFQKRDWKALCTIPYGETRSYKEIAEQIGCTKGYRAVGLANNRNPISIFIPCHRVIGSNGKLVGYGGGLDIKEKLLKLEQKV